MINQRKLRSFQTSASRCHENFNGVGDNIIVTGVSIKFKPLFIGGILLNLIGLGSFFIIRDYHGLSMMLGALVGLIIPGILLNRADRKENV